MTLQLGMSREDRDPADILTSWALKEYERLQQEAPNLGGASIALFKKKFDDPNQAVPDIAEDKFLIKVFNPNAKSSLPVRDIELVSNHVNVEVRAD